MPIFEGIHIKAKMYLRCLINIQCFFNKIALMTTIYTVCLQTILRFVKYTISNDTNKAKKSII